MTAGTFDFERDGATLIVTPSAELGELEFPEIEASAKEMLSLVEDGAVKNIIMDFKRTDHYGSTALGFFVKVWKRVRQRNGLLIFCNLSEHEREILQVTKLDALWPLCATLEDARKALSAKP